MMKKIFTLSCPNCGSSWTFTSHEFLCSGCGNDSYLDTPHTVEFDEFISREEAIAVLNFVERTLPQGYYQAFVKENGYLVQNDTHMSFMTK